MSRSCQLAVLILPFEGARVDFQAVHVQRDGVGRPFGADGVKALVEVERRAVILMLFDEAFILVQEARRPGRRAGGGAVNLVHLVVFAVVHELEEVDLGRVPEPPCLRHIGVHPKRRPSA